ncbi:hypothetical protein RRF57_006742 [Xylaria bambusicola]|uniref:GDP/GTP exchange factor Sec2 N-terminal domain-containing protein n=1 Tax=Xylaria bambusicola TaxID=326684 RepID=A0AAN7Z704_9PEZI
MATTMTMTLPTAASATTSTVPANGLCCPNCGLSLPSPTPDAHKALLQAQRQIEDLQEQIRLLNQKATAAADRWADYEDELSRLRAASTSTNSTTTTSTKNNSTNGTNNNRPHTPDPSVSNSPRSSFLGAGASRISQLLSPRKSPSAAPSSTPPPTATSSNTTATPQQQQRGSLPSVSSPALPLDSHAVEARDLMKALTRERRLRAAAEEKLEATSREVEDLSASLFEQANNMVATERRARAALEERLNELGQRDEEKKARIGRLEGAVMRIERVRRRGGGEEEEDEDGETIEEEAEAEEEETHMRQGREEEKRVGDDGKTEKEEDNKASIRGNGDKETGAILQAAD